MRAWAVVENGADLQEMDWPTPEPKGTEVLLEVTHCGVCHSDLHIWEGYYDMGGGKHMSLKDRGVVLPLAMGHEIVGRVAKLGPDATGVAVGDLRIVFPWLGCGQCERCLAEEDNMCVVANRSLGIYRNGGYATHVVAPHPRHLIDPGTLDPAVAATYACSGVTVYSAVRKVLPMAPTEPIVVVGAGGLGLNAIEVLKALGHKAIVVVDLSDDKLKAAMDAGATTVVNASGEGTTQRILDACGGKLVQVGLFGGEMTLPLPLMPMRALTIQGSYVGNPKELRELVALAQNGGIAALPVTRMPRAEASSALHRLKDGKVTGRIVLTAA